MGRARTTHTKLMFICGPYFYPCIYIFSSFFSFFFPFDCVAKQHPLRWWWRNRPIKKKEEDDDMHHKKKKVIDERAPLWSWWGEIDDGLLRIFLHLARCKREKWRRQLSGREREILFTPKVKKNRGKREALKEKAKKYIQGLFLLLLLHFRVLNNNTHNLTEEGKKEEKVEEKGGAL